VTSSVTAAANSFIDCGGSPPCLGAFTSDILAALERVYDLRTTYDFASVNMSLGGGLFGATCDDEPYKPFIDNLRAAGIATVVASGNDGATAQLSAPACVSSAVSVSATTKDDQVASYSNVAPFLSLFAPGDEIISSYPDSQFAIASGTSMAAPHVAGAWAILKQAAPTASVDEILQALTDTGVMITDPRAGTGTARPRIQVDLALDALLDVENPTPPTLSVTPGSQDFGSVSLGSSADKTFVVRNSGGGTLTGSVSAPAPFSIVSGGSFSLRRGASQTVVVRFSPTALGLSSANVTFTSNGGDASPRVTGIARGVSAIIPNSVDLASPPANFTITGEGISDLGFGLPVVNFMRGSTMLVQVRATALTGTTTLTVPFSAALTVGAVQAQVYMQTGGGSFSPLGTLALTITDTRPVPGVSAISPNTVDLASPPASFTITGTALANLGFGLPVVNFMRGSTLLAQVRATALTGTTTLTVPFSAALTVGAVQAQVYSQTGGGSYSLLGTLAVTITDTRPVATVTAISPDTVDLASPPANFTITGTGLANLGFGLPVVNFMRGSTLLVQVRATALTGTTTLTVPFSAALTVGVVQAQVYSQTGGGSYSLLGTLAVTITDTRPVATVTAINPNAVDLASPPASFTITGTGLANLGFGLPVVNFMRGSAMLAQARATALAGTTTLTVPFSAALTVGVVQAQVYSQTGSGSYSLMGALPLTVTDTRP